MSIYKACKGSMVIITSCLLGIYGVMGEVSSMNPCDKGGVSGAMVVRPKQFTEVQKTMYIKALGYSIGQRSGLDTLGFSDTEWNTFLIGMKATTPPMDTQLDWDNATEYFTARSEANITKKIAEQKKLNGEFFEKLAKGGVKKTDTGLFYEIITPGTNPKPTVNDTVMVNYKVSFINGNLLEDSKAPRDGSAQASGPVELSLNGVIPGFSEGLQLVGKGGKIKLYVPSDLAYGDMTRPGIPPASALIFEAELVDIKNGDKDINLKQIMGSTTNNSGVSQSPSK